jgi:hypothetical protein
LPTFSTIQHRGRDYPPAPPRERYFPLYDQGPFGPFDAGMPGSDIDSDGELSGAVQAAIDSALASPAPAQRIDGSTRG